MNAMMIVESPSKAKTIGKYLRGMGIQVHASIGHVRGLDTSIKNSGAVEPDHGFKMHFINTVKNAKNTKDLLQSAKRVDTVYLATDPDREGEAISWHLMELIRQANPRVSFKRVTYQEVNEKAVKDAIANSRDLNMDMVESQFARSASDYLFGFNVSPILWKVIARGLSAGRVQSPALRLLAEHEELIRQFKPMTYWSMTIKSEKDQITFPALLNRIEGNTFSKQDLSENTYSVDFVNQHKGQIESLIKKGEKLLVKSVKTSKKSRKPKAPYITSTLQMDAVRKFGWSATRIMGAAQKLFEGDGGEHGYITYHRTDSVTLSQEALQSIFAYGKQNYSDFMMDRPVEYKGKNKNAQEAHEAIRPSDIGLTPEQIKSRIGNDEYRLYKLIWSRTLASQMKPALFDSTQVTFDLSKDYGFKTSGSVLVFKGYLAVYQEGSEIDGDKEDDYSLPVLNEHDQLKVIDFTCDEHQTKPPARFNEASLVKSLEEYGIGRPSTYASITRTLLDRGYITVENNRITVTEMGEEVTKYLKDKFSDFVDYQFTDKLNNQLDEISEGKLNWKTVMYDFWNPLKKIVEVEKKTSSGTGILEKTSEICPKCGQGNLNIMIGRYGKFKACDRGKKECGYVVSLNEKPTKTVEVYEGKKCPLCQSDLHIKTNKKGQKFLGCSTYPTCKYLCNMDGTENKTSTSTDTGIICPKCNKYPLHISNGRYGKMISCSGYRDNRACSNIVKKDEFAKLSGKTIEEVKAMLS